MLYKIIKDRNAGNSANTYYKACAANEFCIYDIVAQEYVRSKSGKVIRYSHWSTALKKLVQSGVLKSEIEY